MTLSPPPAPLPRGRPQLRAFALARQRAERMAGRVGDAVLDAQLKLVGSVRNTADEALVDSLKRERA